MKCPIVLEPNAYTKSTQEHEEHIRKVFQRLWKAPSKNYYPGANPVSLSLDTLSRINMNEYVVAEKTDGVRYSLLLCLDEKGQPCATMINRACKQYPVRIHASDSFFAGTLFEGELVWQVKNDSEGRLVWLVFDAIALEGYSLSDKNYLSRLDCIKTYFTSKQQCTNMTMERVQYSATMKKIVPFNNAYNLTFIPKEYTHPANIDSLWNNMSQMDHKCDGLIFTPIKDGIVHGTHWNQFKWKYENTIDLQLRAKKTDTWQFSLYYIDANYTVKPTTLHNTQVDTSDDKQQPLWINASRGMIYNNQRLFFVVEPNIVLMSLLHEVEQKKNTFFSCIVECTASFDEDNEQLHCFLKTLRSDKSEPNNSFTVTQTLKNMKESIPYEIVRHRILECKNNDNTNKCLL